MTSDPFPAAASGAAATGRPHGRHADASAAASGAAATGRPHGRQADARASGSTARRALAAIALLAAALPAAAHAVALDVRTVRVSTAPGSTSADGASANPALSAGGALIAFDTAATKIAGTAANGATRDVVLAEPAANRTTLISQGPGGAPANGDSRTPALSGDGSRVAFVSEASNLVAGDGNALADVFARDRSGVIQRVSVALDGGDPNGPSSEPDISKDGRFVAFTSAASNLVTGDSNGQPDVFVRDLARQATIRVSRGADQGPAAGLSSAPAIAASGRFVSFQSTAPNIVAGDTNGIADVFVADLVGGAVKRVSVSTSRRQQNKAVIAPFEQISDVSSTGRYVVFDSDATNLVKGDRNKDTDVFIRDLEKGTTGRVSLLPGGLEADNDSFSPSITPNGRYVAFESFAENLAPGDATGEDVFVHDRNRGATVVANVTNSGAPRGAETVKQLLQRPALSEDARVVGFSSTAENLVRGDDNGLQDVFVRLMAPPRGAFERRPRRIEHTNRPVYAFRTDDPFASEFLCEVDGIPFFCRKTGRLPRLSPGRHVLTARAGGPGMLFQSRPLRTTFRVRPR